jgi:hypothetical protein
LSLYLYGVVRRGRLPQRLARRGVRLVVSGPLAGLVSDVSSALVDATRRNLVGHAEIVEDAFEWTTVLPTRFGVVLPDAAAVRTQVLDANRELLVALLDEHEATAELTLRAEYDEDAVLAELVRERPRLGRLRTRYTQAPTFEHGLELGESVAAELGDRRDRDAARIVAALEPLALTLRVGEVTVQGGVVSLTLLMARERVDDVEARVVELANELSPPVRFRLVGPLPPYSFVDVPLAVAA